jgi:hypothetical protein
VRINRDSRGWIVACILILGAATATYVPYMQNSEKSGGPSGGSWYGIIYGSVGSAMMLFALLLGLKKRLRTMRIGRAYWWMQGHVWLGLIAYPIILLHAGFRWGGPYTQILMWLFTIVVVSGIIGIIIQQLMPSLLLRDVQYETIYEQIEHVVEQLQQEADAIAQTVVGETGGEAYETEVVPAGSAVATAAQTNVKAAKDFLQFYSAEVKPYLNRRIPDGTKFNSELAAQVVFDHVRATMPRSIHPALTDLAAIVEERRQLAEQKKMHHILHGWLIMHVPLSYGLIVLAAVHAVQALRYVRPHW